MPYANIITDHGVGKNEYAWNDKSQLNLGVGFI